MFEQNFSRFVQRFWCFPKDFSLTVNIMKLVLTEVDLRGRLPLWIKLNKIRQRIRLNHDIGNNS